MARRTKEDTQITINTILDVATEQLIKLGYEKMSYTTLSEQSGISRTGISHHFAKKADIPRALQGRLLKIMADKLNMSGNEKDFIDSWEHAFGDEAFMAIWRLAFLMTVCEHHTPYLNEIQTQIETVASFKLNKSCQRTIEWLIGVTLLSLQKS
ncbi:MULTISPECIES: TetR/AcrR family transcriptional regulator [Vibrio harveyi group]|uniref:TetR/AcrR family transcriptional regulator n=1 Tax=Vibrio harveyi group TaxID=717610 RepID=UPI0003A3CC03|nr:MULTISPECIES: TetR/AcrR family transcriptional regulator [Vibrio harveyi group]PAW07773.1 TetR/AcrR family transcriptional regulator [Vibrio sp. V1B]